MKRSGYHGAVIVALALLSSGCVNNFAGATIGSGASVGNGTSVGVNGGVGAQTNGNATSPSAPTATAPAPASTPDHPPVLPTATPAPVTAATPSPVPTAITCLPWPGCLDAVVGTPVPATNQTPTPMAYPEIVAVEPLNGAMNVDPNKVSVRLTLSEALDVTNLNRFRAALRIIPADFAPGASVSDLTDQGNTHSLTNVASTLAAAGVIQEGSRFLSSSSVLASCVFDAEGRVATFNFNAPIVRDRNQALKYQVVLVGSANAIVDKDNQQLGTNAAGAHQGYDANGLVWNAFKKASAAGSSWDAAHDNGVTFQVARDEVMPSLMAIAVSGRNIVTLTLSEPMVAYNGSSNTKGYNPDGTTGGLYDLNNYHFSVADSAASLAASGGMNVVAKTASGFGDTSNVGSSVFKFDKAAGKVRIEVDPVDPRIVRLIATDNMAFAPNLTNIKVWVDGVRDIAGNLLVNTGGANVVTGNI